MSQELLSSRAGAERTVRDIRRKTRKQYRPKRISGSCYGVCVARTASLSCAAGKGSPKVCITVGRRSSWKLAGSGFRVTPYARRPRVAAKPVRMGSELPAADVHHRAPRQEPVEGQKDSARPRRGTGQEARPSTALVYLSITRLCAALQMPHRPRIAGRTKSACRS